MKYYLFILFIMLAGLIYAKEHKMVKVLMIGNSFSLPVIKNMPEMVKSLPNKELHITSMYIGGCSLMEHYSNLKKAIEDPNYKPYFIEIRKSTTINKISKLRSNLPEILQNTQYDIISIQQVSSTSWNYKTFQPYANNIIEYIRQNNPKAEIMVQQTWAYRIDDYRILSRKNYWNFDQTEMYKYLTKNYEKLAREHNLRIIPTGKAVQIFRERSPVKFKIKTPKELKKYKYPELPQNSGDVVGKSFWFKNKKSGETKIKVDTIHLNEAGEYLQSAVWTGVLFNISPNKIKYNHPKLSNEHCKFLRDCANQAIKK